MGTKFLYLKVNNDDAFDNSINPQVGNVVVYLTKDANNNFVWMTKDQNGNYCQLGSVVQNNTENFASIAQVTNIDQDGLVTTNTLNFENGKPYLTQSTNTVSPYTFSGVPIIIEAILPNNQEISFQLQNIYANGYNRIWIKGTKKIYYNIAYERWNLEDLNTSTIIDYTIETQEQPYDSTWANGSELIKK